MERPFESCYDRWIQGQKSDLTTLLGVATSPSTTEMQLRSVVEQCMESYENYNERRKALIRQDGPTFCCPPWCSSFENSVLWIGGCRPSLMIRLLYSLTGCEMEAHLEEFLQGQQTPNNVGLMNLSSCQLNLVNNLHQRTLRAEDRLTSKQASLQEDIADKPLFPVIREIQRTTTTTTTTTTTASTSAGSTSTATASSSSPPYRVDGTQRCLDVGQSNEDMTAAMKTYADGMGKLVEEADALRLATAKTLAMEILTPKQAIELLIAAKQLYLSVHDWGLQRDRQHGLT